MSKTELQETIVRLTKKFNASKSQASKWKMIAYRSQEAAAKAKRELSAMKSEAQSQAFLKDGKRRKSTQPRKHYRMTTTGMYKLAWKQSIGYGGASSTLAILEIPLKKNQVPVCERLLAGSFFVAARAWYKDMYAELSNYVVALGKQGNQELGGRDGLAFLRNTCSSGRRDQLLHSAGSHTFRVWEFYSV